MYTLIETTTDKKAIADIISDKILSNNLSPCIQIDQNTLTKYKWNNKIDDAIEFRLSIKTIDRYTDKVISIINDNHNYEVPEIIKKDFNILSEKYEKWFNDNIKGEI